MKLPRACVNVLLASMILACAASCSDAPAPKPPAPIVPAAPGASTPAAGSAPSAAPSASAPTSSSPSAVAASGVDPSTWKTSSSADDPTVLEVAGLRAPKPATWVWTKPTMQFRTLQYAVPGEGDSTKGAELIVSVFVAGDGGPLEANITRWKS